MAAPMAITEGTCLLVLIISVFRPICKNRDLFMLFIHVGVGSEVVNYVPRVYPHFVAGVRTFIQRRVFVFSLVELQLRENKIFALVHSFFAYFEVVHLRLFS